MTPRAVTDLTFIVNKNLTFIVKIFQTFIVKSHTHDLVFTGVKIHIHEIV
jgi:hypothetical protein